MDSAAYEQLLAELRNIGVLGSCRAVLEWDEQTYMPPGGAEFRAEQLSLLAGMVHQRITSDEIGDLLAKVEQALGPEPAESNGPDPLRANVRETRRRYDRATRLPQTLVEEMTRTTSLAQQAWIAARKQNQFAEFQPWLERVIKLKREEAACVGGGDGHPYDALLDDFEPGATADFVQSVFDPLREELVAFVQRLQGSSTPPDASVLTRRYPIDAQRELGLMAAERIGFDFQAGRLDIAAHPFCSGFGPGDCRLTTRYDEHHFPGAFFGTLHEAGHGMYEQGLNAEAFGTPLGDSVSLGIHESQSRLWENFVGRSQAFWKWLYPTAQQHFPEALGETSLADFHAAINSVQPSLIRVEADEVTYNLHIMLRFELELKLIGGDLDAAEVPAAWNAAYESYLGIVPPDDASGCLQDIHWSAGLIGYFPTYALGNLYAAQLFAAARRELGDLDAMFAEGDFQPLKRWLNQNVHQPGKLREAPELVRHVTNEPLSHEPLMRHLRNRFEPIYNLAD